MQEEKPIDLSEYIGMYRPAYPPFGYPLMDFYENPLQKIQNETVKINNLFELEQQKNVIKEFEARMHIRNWNKMAITLSPNCPIRGQLHEK